MGLQLRMTHALGERLVEVEARSADCAIVVGRASNAEVQVPSASIAKRHCVLFVREGRWVVQDANSPSGTFLNGARLTEPAFVKSGDVLALGEGSNPPTLTVDPHSIGVSEEMDGPAPAAPIPAAAPSRANWSAPSTPAPRAGMPPPLIPQFAQPPQGFVQEEDNDDIFGAPVAAPTYSQHTAFAVPGSVPGYGAPVPGPVVDEWAAVSSASATPRRRVVKQQGVSGLTIAFVALLSIAIVIGGGVLVYKMYHKVDEATKPKVIKEETREPNKGNSIFDFQPPPKPGKTSAGNSAPPAVAANIVDSAAAKTMPLARTPAPTTAPAEPVPDKRREDPEWDAVERARSQGEPVQAIIKYGDYMDRFPDNPNAKDINRYTDEALDLIWWKRLNDLFAERDETLKQIASRKYDISLSLDADFKKGLEKEIARFAETRDSIDDIIRNQMKFAGQSAPNLYDSQDLAIARKTRDAKYFDEVWKVQVLKAIKSSHGQRLPWRSPR